jgi:hypothetical protein
VADMLYLAFLTTLLLLVVLAAALLQPEWAHDVCLDRWDVKSLDGALVPGAEGCNPDDRMRVLDQLIAERHRIVSDLVEGRLTPSEAADAFRRLNEQHGTPHYYDTSSGASEEECVHRHLLRWVRIALQQRSPDTADYLAAQIEAELRHHRFEARAGSTP